MSVMERLGNIMGSGRDVVSNTLPGEFVCRCQNLAQAGTAQGGILARGDNLAFMKYLEEKKKLKGKIQTIYADPPFFTKSKYQGSFKVAKDMPAVKPEAYRDRWNNGLEGYLSMLTPRLLMMKELLAEDGLIWMHLDWHVVHYVKVLMDEIFGSENFVNEIIWQYKSGGSSKKHFGRKHDTILLYSKSGKYKLYVGKEKSYNRGFKPYRFKGVEEFEDENGWYTLVNRKDIWQIDMVGRTSKERTGYATQKPLELMKQIIESSTDEGDLAADFFCGAGGFAEAAERSSRRWICCDQGDLAVGVTEKRLLEKEIPYSLLIEQSKDAQALDQPDDDNIELKVTAKRIGLGMLKVTIDEYKVPEKQLIRCGLTAGARASGLISHWSVDTEYDGCIHQNRVVITRKDGSPELETILVMPAWERINVRVTDVLGNTAQQTVSLME